MVWTNGSLYEGYWKTDKQHGRGRLIYGNGLTHYIGEWKYGKKEGYGEEHYKDGTFYRGMWKKGLRNGHAVVKLQNGKLMKGVWENDRLYSWTSKPFDEKMFNFQMSPMSPESDKES